MKFSQDAKGEIASLAAQVNATSKGLEELKSQISTKPLSVQAKADIFEASQTVSNQTADLANVKSDKGGSGPEVRGFIWIGDYAAGAWTRTKLVSPTTNAALSDPPTSIAAGTTFAVSANMVLRDSLPRNDAEYFQGRKSLGIVATGTKVRVLAAPVAIDREFAVQYWVQVAVPQ